MGNLKWDVTDEILKEALKQFQPTEVMVFRNMTGRSRGFALVKFESEEKGIMSSFTCFQTGNLT